MTQRAPKGVDSEAYVPIAGRVADLLDRMTLEEKVAQLGSINADAVLDGSELDEAAVEEHLSDGIGHLTRIGGEGGLDPDDAARVTNELQTYLLEETRLGIPAIPHEECLSGYMGPEGTTFPQMLGMACSWDPGLLTEVTAQIRSELEAIGTTHVLSPVLDLARDMRWGRVEETFGEDPLLCAAMATAYVRGIQGSPGEEAISATLKHFAGHGATEGAKNRSSLNVGPRELRELHLFPYEATIATADAESVMNAYHDIDGVPCASSEWLLTDVLRGEFGFDGTVVSDYYSIRHLVTEHGTAAEKPEAASDALEAGLDIELPYTEYYGDPLIEAVEGGDLAESVIDTSVERILRKKIEKGLFGDPFVDAEAAPEAFNTDTATELTERAARKSMTLLKNDGTLPLENVGSVAVIGPKADNGTELLGDYAYAAHYPEEEYDFDAITPLDAFRARDDLEVTHEQGCTISGRDRSNFEQARSAAASADVAVAFVGARSAVDFSDVDADMREKPTVPTSGEGCDITDLGLPGVQGELLETMFETDTPVVVVVISGKPPSIPDVVEDAAGLIFAGLPGERGGVAIADAVFGEYAPGGKLPLSVPKSVGQQPVWYNRKANTANKTYVYTDAEPLFPFGFGDSYTTFAYRDIEATSTSLDPAGSLTVGVTVENVGGVAGDEIVQCYQHAANPSLARPVQELVAFERVSLSPGESRRVSFTIDAAQLAYHDVDMNLAVEEGHYEIRIGRSAADIEGTVDIAVTGTKSIPRCGRTYFANTSVQ